MLLLCENNGRLDARAAHFDLAVAQADLEDRLRVHRGALEDPPIFQ